MRTKPISETGEKYGPQSQQLINDAVADALSWLAEFIKFGTPLEDIPHNRAYGLHTSYSEIYRAVLDEVKAVLIMHREHGSSSDRIKSGEGMILQPLGAREPMLTTLEELIVLAQDKVNIPDAKAARPYWSGFRDGLKRAVFVVRGEG